jgi:cytochrome c2
MKWTVISVFLLLLLAVESAFIRPLFSQTQNPLAGSRVFGAKGCAKCHSVNGVGGKIGPDLGRVSRPRSSHDLATAMWNHLPRMVERMQQLGITRPRLDARETGDLMAFLLTLNYFDLPADVEAGRRLFTEKRCVVCHQVGGTGGVVGPNLDFLGQHLSPIFIAAALWNHGPAMAAAMRARGIERPTFKDYELLDLIAYLKSASPGPREEMLYVLSGRADVGERLFVEKRCIECHSVGERGGRVGPDLAGRGLYRSPIQFAMAMWNKTPAMTEAMKARGISVPQLRADEMADLVSYLYAVRYFAEPGDVRLGSRVASEKGCLRCHTISGAGTGGPLDLASVKSLDSPAAFISALWNHGAILEQRSERQKGAWPEFRSEEMADLLAFLQSLGRRK